MSKYSRFCGSDFWVRKQREQADSIAKQQAHLEQSMVQGYSVALEYQGDHKRDRSADIFSTNRVSTCAYIKRRRGSCSGSATNGNVSYEAIPFYARPYTAAHIASPEESALQKSFYATSTNSDSYRQRSHSHAGMGSAKPLTPYDPTAQRSRLPIVDFKQYYVNRSVIELGDRNSKTNTKKQYITTNKHLMGRNPHKTFTSKHPGILTYQVKWDNHLKTQ